MPPVASDKFHWRSVMLTPSKWQSPSSALPAGGSSLLLLIARPGCIIPRELISKIRERWKALKNREFAVPLEDHISSYRPIASRFPRAHSSDCSFCFFLCKTPIVSRKYNSHYISPMLHITLLLGARISSIGCCKGPGRIVVQVEAANQREEMCRHKIHEEAMLTRWRHIGVGAVRTQFAPSLQYPMP